MSTAETYLLQKAKDEFDWEEYLEDHYEIMHTSDKQEFRICCPNCSERKYKCYVNVDKGVFNCFKCDFQTGRRFDVVNFIATTEGLTYVNALLKLTSEYSPTALSKENMDAWVSSLSEKAEVAEAAAKVELPNVKPITFDDSDPVWLYAKNRGLSQKLLTEVGALGLYNDNRYGTRLLFPIYAGDAVLVSWQARDVTGKSEAKYLSAMHSKLSDFIWPNVASKDPVVLVEGIIDAISIRESTSYSAYATFGKHISVAHCQKLVRMGVRSVILWYDKRDAHKDMVKAVNLLKDYVDNVYVVSFEGWDSSIDVGDLLKVPKELSKRTIEKQLASLISCESLEYTKWSLCL